MYTSPQLVKTVGSSKRAQHSSMVTRRRNLTEQNVHAHPLTRKTGLTKKNASDGSAKRYTMKPVLPGRKQLNRPFSSFTRKKYNGLVKKKNTLTSEDDDEGKNVSDVEIVPKRKRKEKKTKGALSFVKTKLIKLKKATTKKKLVLARPLSRPKSVVDNPSDTRKAGNNLEGVLSNRRRLTIVNYKELDEGPRDEDELHAASSQNRRTPGGNGGIRRKRTIAKHHEIYQGSKEDNLGQNVSSHDRNTPESSVNALKKRAAVEVGSTLSPSKKYKEAKSQREFRRNIRNQVVNSSNNALDLSDSSNSSRTVSEHALASFPKKRQQEQTKTHLKNQHLSSSPGQGAMSHSKSHLSKTDDADEPDDDLGVRRSSRASTQNSTRATCSALIASSADGLHDAPKQRLPMPRSKLCIGTRSQGERSVRYQEDSDFDYDDVDSDASITGDDPEKERAYSDRSSEISL